MTVRSARSPLSHGFVIGGAFSPDGTQLALFGLVGRYAAARLELLNLITGRVRVAREPQLALDAGIGWARWLPDGRRLVMGPATVGGYLVDTTTLSARPLRLIRGRVMPGTILDTDYRLREEADAVVVSVTKVATGPMTEEEAAGIARFGDLTGYAPAIQKLAAS